MYLGARRSSGTQPSRVVHCHRTLHCCACAKQRTGGHHRCQHPTGMCVDIRAPKAHHATPQGQHGTNNGRQHFSSPRSRWGWRHLAFAVVIAFAVVTGDGQGTDGATDGSSSAVDMSPVPAMRFMWFTPILELPLSEPESFTEALADRASQVLCCTTTATITTTTNTNAPTPPVHSSALHTTHQVVCRVQERAPAYHRRMRPRQGVRPATCERA